MNRKPNRVTDLGVKFLLKLKNRTRQIDGVSKIKIFPVSVSGERDIDALIKFITYRPLSVNLIEKIAEAVSEAKWEVFEESGELPAVEWEIERVNRSPQSRWKVQMYGISSRRKRRTLMRRNGKAVLRFASLNFLRKP